MTDIPPNRPRRAALLTLAALCFLIGFGAPATGSDEDPSLKQRIGADQKVGRGQVELGKGHVDLGPRYVDGKWTLMVHDDSELAGSVWRDLADVVFRVHDSAELKVPDDPAYSFLGTSPGQSVHVVPQTQNDGVVWLGWNTQDPGVLASIDRGATLTLDGVDGPGDLVVYLQSGTFGEPDVLWDSRRNEAQDLWVDINTHTHANWVFTEPGTYVVRLKAAADLTDGTTVTDTRLLRLAVGDQVSTREAFAKTSNLPAPTTGDGGSAGQAAEKESEGSNVLPVVGATALVVAGAVLVIVIRGRRARNAAYPRPEEV